MSTKNIQIYPCTLVLEIFDRDGENSMMYRYNVSSKRDLFNIIDIKIPSQHKLKDRKYLIYLEVKSSMK